MKKILIVICDMGIGGAQKSLCSFLNAMQESGKANNYEISVMVINPVGAFMDKLPDSVHRIAPPTQLRWLGTPFGRQLLTKHFSVRALLGQCLWVGRKWLGLFPKGCNLQQRLWDSWKNLVPEQKTQYDVAIGYIDGVPSYYVMDKVKAERKILWIHSEYQKQGYDPDFDRPFFDRAQKLITISGECRQCILRQFPEYEKKVTVLENIIRPGQIIEKSRERVCDAFGTDKGMKLLSVGRLHRQKGFDIAIEAAQELERRQIPFTWLIVGMGPEYDRLDKSITQKGLEHRVRLIGARENPYGYMGSCDLLVQTSRVEGRSIVLDEARILCKPVVVTNYQTAGDSVIHETTGLLTDMNPTAVADAIERLFNDRQLYEQICKNLTQLPKGNEKELQRYLETMLD